MTPVDFSRRVRAKTLSADITAYHGLSTVSKYTAVRPEASAKSLETSYGSMIAQQKREAELAANMKSAADAARKAEVDFHDAVLAMKESVRGQFGPNSDEAQAVGYKKKSEYKRPRRTRRQPATPMPA
ncbi:MAG: hypothetical protein DCF25_12595 [Leptolyngbya foveolarum]|uniref:Uncharacterized protein n=1 Tax=Leptolyngbya foveolarum TaxID=47253 RepID=A0A2W4UB76_9CYAN|nr:MAG: hypothetical protein DCF25_12595 [Leptolyngbya foveolarum]